MQSYNIDTSTQQYWFALSGMAGVRIKKLLCFVEKCGSVEAAFYILQERSSGTEVFSQKERDSISKALSAHNPELFFTLKKNKEFTMISFDDPSYPQLLRKIESPPLIMYVKGSLAPEDLRSIAVVGARAATPYGKENARRIAADLSHSGYVVVSGLAKGIDTWAHRGALEAGGRTIAVLGCGIDTVYPAENRALSEQIVEEGAVISEFPPGTPALRQNFPMRNRIIAGMTLGTLVVEAGEKSGSLITAEMALNCGREVFAIPGSITSKLSKGTNQLIKEGATLVDSVEDITGDLWINRQVTMKKSRPDSAQNSAKDDSAKERFTADERALLEHLGDEGKTPAVIAELSGLEPSRAMASLSLLELKGFIRRGAENLIFGSEKLKASIISKCDNTAHQRQSRDVF